MNVALIGLLITLALFVVIYQILSIALNASEKQSHNEALYRAYMRSRMYDIMKKIIERDIIISMEQQLKHAIDIEDYEQAARIRDMIAKQNASQPLHGDNKTK